jgi:hypothetical protein
MVELSGWWAATPCQGLKARASFIAGCTASFQLS